MDQRPDPDPTPEGEQQPLARARKVGAGVAGVLSILLVGSVFAVPILGLFLAPLGLIPVLHHQAGAARWYLAWSWVAVLLAVATVSGLAPLTAPLLAAYLLVVVIPSISVQWWKLLGWSEGRWAAITAATCAACVMVVVAMMAAPEAPMDAVARWMRETAAQTQEFYSAMGFARGELELALDTVELYASWVLPAIPVAYLVAVLFWVRPRLPLLGVPVRAGVFEQYRSEEWLPVGFAAAGLGTVFLDGTPRWVAVNFLLTVLILYFVHGLAIIRAHLARWFGRGWLVRWGAVLLCLQMPFPPLVAILGVADSFYPLRPRPKDDGGQRQ